MQRVLVLLIPAALIAGQVRYARLGEFEGGAEVQIHAADSWAAAERNLPLTESTWLRTAAVSRLEVELDEGSAWRLGPNSQAGMADYSRLSTGQRVTLLSLERGLAYFTGEPQGKDALSLAVPGAQITLMRGARVRLEAQSDWSRISVIEGAVRFSSPAAEMDLREGQTVRVEPANPSRFFLDRAVPPMDLDGWSEDRDKALEASASAAHVAQRYGLKDLDTAGQWIQTADLGMVWKPMVAGGWAPFQKGRWRWYDALGYTWVSDDAWGWLPYHYGRWARSDGAWVWAPGAMAVFKPGDVYWLHAARLAGWGPLAPGENWPGSTTPQLFSDAVTTYAGFQQDARLIDPAGLVARPQNPPPAGAFTLALPSPALIPVRLEAQRPMLRAGNARVNPMVPGLSVDDNPAPSAYEPPPPPITDPGSIDPSAPGPPVDPQGPPPGVMYPPPPTVPGIIIVTPPGNPDYSRRFPPNRTPAPAQPPVTSGGGATGSGTAPTAGGEPPVKPPSGRPRVVPAEVPRVEPPHPVTREARNDTKPTGTPPATQPPAAQPPAAQPPVRPPEVRPRAVPVEVPRVEGRHETSRETKAESKPDPSSSDGKPAAPAKTDTPGTSVGAKK